MTSRFQRMGNPIWITILALFTVMCLGISTHSEIPEASVSFKVEFEEDDVIKYGYGYVWCGDLAYVQPGNGLAPYAESGHDVSFYHYLENEDVRCHYKFWTQVDERPDYNASSSDSGTARRYDPDTNTVDTYSYGTNNFLSLSGLPGRKEPYTLSSYSRLRVGETTKKANAWIKFNHN